MLHLLAILGNLLLFFFTHESTATAVCGNNIVWRNQNITCPHRAVCADVFEMVRDWRNGTMCKERRVLSNCLCSGGTVCPTDNPAHALSYSHRRKYYLCEPACRLPYCPYVSRSNPASVAINPGAARVRTGPTRARDRPIAYYMEHEAPEFGNKNYYKVSCRCQQNYFLPNPRDYRRWAVKFIGPRTFPAQNRRVSQYVCNTANGEQQRPDPCERIED